MDNNEDLVELIKKVNDEFKKAKRLANSGIYTRLKALELFDEQIKRISQMARLARLDLQSSLKRVHELRNLQIPNIGAFAVLGVLPTIKRALKNLDLASHKINRILVSIGWMPVKSIYLSQKAQIIALYDEKGLEAKPEIEEILVQNFDNETIGQILNNWKEYEWLSHRIRLMSMGVKAHMRGEYALSVPQLLTHVEGIVRDYYQYDTWVNQKVIKKDAKKIIYGFDEDGENQTWLSYEFNQATFEFYKEHIMAGFTDRPKSEISRHAIFHGVDLDYDNVCNSLKIILLLDHMIAQINEMKKIEDKEVS